MIDAWISMWSSLRMSASISKHVVSIAGQKFGRLTVISHSGTDPRGYSIWNCRCDCGTLKSFSSDTLKKGHSRSCGCLKRDEFLKRVTKHGHASKSSGSSEYRVWVNMVARCSRQNHPQYHLYGGRGISVCKEWLSFQNFIRDVGYRPSLKHSIHRVNNDKGYEKGNVKWATSYEQQNTRSNNHRITFGEITLTITQWARKIGIPQVTLNYRLRRGWSIERALTTPLQKRT